MKRLVLGILLALAVSTPVSAKEDSITLNEPLPVMGGQVTFTIVIDKNKDCTGKPACGFVNIACYQDLPNADGVPQSTLVWYAGPVSIADARAFGFTLGLGTGGPATCIAEIDNYHRAVVYASTTFIAAG